MKNLQGTNSGRDEAKNHINDLEREEEKSSQSEQQEEKNSKKNEDTQRSLWDNMNHNIHNIIGVPEGEERGQTVKNLFEEIMTKNFLILVKEKDTQVQEAQRVPNKMNPKRPIPRHIIIKMPKVRDKERILKVVRERQLVTYRRVPIRL